MGNNYSYQGETGEKTVKVLGRFLPVSRKASYEVAAAIRGKGVNKAINYLERVTTKKDAIPFRRYLKDVPHRKGRMTAGRYPRKASEHVLNLLKTLKKNAESKNLDADKLKIVHSAAQKGPNIMRRGRVRGRRKVTHIELVAKEVAEKEKKK